MNKKILAFGEFRERVIVLEEVYDLCINTQMSLEEAFDELEARGINAEEVCTGDIAQVTKPIMTLKRDKMYEKAPEGKESEKWVLANKSKFKREYGDNWEQILYATAWKIFGNKEKA